MSTDPESLRDREQRHTLGDAPADEAEIRFAVSAIVKIDAAGLLPDFERTLGKELRNLQTRQANIAAYRSGNLGRYVARMMHVDEQRCIMAARDKLVGTRQSIVRAELETYLKMIHQRDEREKAKGIMVAEYFAGCAEEMHRDWIVAPNAPAETVAKPVPAERPQCHPIPIHPAESVPISVQLARAKAKRKLA